MTPYVLHTRATLCPLVAPRGAHSGCCVLQEVLFQTANVVLLCCFTVEMLVKVIALGPRNYWADNWNKLDGSTVVTSWIGEMVEGIGGVQALRAMRVIRLVMLLKHATTLRSLIGTLVKSLIPASNIFCLLVLVYFCYGVLGMYLYGEMEYGEKITELDNFDNIFNAMKLLFQASTGQVSGTVVLSTTLPELNCCCNTGFHESDARTRAEGRPFRVSVLLHLPHRGHLGFLQLLRRGGARELRAQLRRVGLNAGCRFACVLPTS